MDVILSRFYPEAMAQKDPKGRFIHGQWSRTGIQHKHRDWLGGLVIGFAGVRPNNGNWVLSGPLSTPKCAQKNTPTSPGPLHASNRQTRGSACLPHSQRVLL